MGLAVGLGVGRCVLGTPVDRQRRVPDSVHGRTIRCCVEWCMHACMRTQQDVAGRRLPLQFHLARIKGGALAFVALTDVACAARLGPPHTEHRLSCVTRYWLSETTTTNSPVHTYVQTSPPVKPPTKELKR